MFNRFGANLLLFAFIDSNKIVLWEFLFTVWSDPLIPSEAMPLLEEMNFELFLKGNAASSTKNAQRFHIFFREVAKAFCDKREALYVAIWFTSPTAHQSFGWMEKIEDNRQHTKSSVAMLARKKMRSEDFLHVLFYWRKNKRMTSLNIKSQSPWTSIGECQWTLVIAGRCCCLSISVILCLLDFCREFVRNDKFDAFLEFSLRLEKLVRMYLLRNCFGFGSFRKRSHVTVFLKK